MKNPLDLSPEQAAAAQAPLGDLCVLAGAGSGKTRVLTARFVEHVVEHGLAPRSVAALTFTEKAAREMRKRIGEAFVSVGRPALALEADEAPISTLHAFCARLLRRNAVVAGLDPSFSVLDENAALLLKAEALERATERLEARPEAPALRAALARLAALKPLETLLKLLEQVRAAGGRVEALAWREGSGGLAGARRAVTEARRELQLCLGGWLGAPKEAREALARVERAEAGAADPDEAWRAVGELAIGGKGSQPSRSARSALKAALEGLEAALLDMEGRERVLPHLKTILSEIDRAYAELKARREGLDFTDLEREAVKLFDLLAARRRPAEGLPRALLVDEHQDTNPVQERLLAAVRAHGVPQFSVGDPKQSIYRFRGADVGVLLGEEARVGVARQKSLASSYRATPQLVATLNGLGERLFANAAAGVPFAPLLAAGAFHGAASGAPPPFTLALLRRGEQDVTVGRRREAAFIAGWLRSIQEGGVLRRLEGDRRPLVWGDCAILLRARSDLALYEQGLTAAGIPFRVHRGRGYLEAEEIEALHHALRVVHNPSDRHALACFVRGPALAASDADLLAWFVPGTDPWTALSADTRPRVTEVVTAVGDLRRLSARGDLPEVVGAAVERLGLLTAALAQPDGARRAANLRRAVGLAAELAEAGRHDLAAFLRHLELLGSLEVEQAEAPALGDDGDAVTLLTVHAAKGLEWPVVVLADAGRGPPPSAPAFLLEGAERVALRLRHELEGEGSPCAGLQELIERDGAAAEAEALRLLYVAMTRAEQHLLITATHQGPTATGEPKGALGWARRLFAALRLDLEEGRRDVAVEDGLAAVWIEEAPPELVPVAGPAPDVGAPSASIEADAQAHLARVALAPSPLGGTRYVVSVSELLTFAASPADLYRQRLLPRDRPLASVRERVRGPSKEREAGEPDVSEERRLLLEETRAGWDEPAVPGGLDRAALGRSVHLAIERWVPGRPVGEALEGVLEAGHEGPVPPGARALAAEMLARFETSAVAHDLATAVAAGGDQRREAAFHARVRFPAGATVAGFEHLLVRGTIDLWLPRAGGIWIVDHKTNMRSAAHPTPASLAAYYAPQLRLYALAAERLLGGDVAGAALLLLDPGWGPTALEVPIDVSGPALEETRRLCQAFAEAERVDRWPADWRDLLR